MSLYLLDTNIVSDLMHDPDGRAARAARKISRVTPEAQFHISVVVDCELRYGLARKPQQRLQAAYDRTVAMLTVEPLGLDVADHYAQLRSQMATRGYGLDANDTLIAAHALALGATLVSGDAAFARVPGLALENWLSEES